MWQNLFIFSVLIVGIFSQPIQIVGRDFYRDNSPIQFRGVNAVVKGEPWFPSTANFDPKISLTHQDFQILSQSGINMIRLGIMWPGVQPLSPNEYNMTYLETIRNISRNAYEYGIYTLLDLHQDVLSDRTCGEGVPSWFPLYLEGFPRPLVLKPFKSLGECDKKPWTDYHMSLAVAIGFEYLYQNPGDFHRLWENITLYFKGEPQILGFELINEPWCGNQYSNPLLLVPEKANRRLLESLYQETIQRIHEIDPMRIVFIEPVTWSDIDLGWSELPNNTIISFHYYIDINPPFHFHLSHYLRESARLDRPIFLTEFDLSTWDEVSILTKQYNTSWAIWEYKDFCQDRFGACKTGYGGYFFTAEGERNETTFQRLKNVVRVNMDPKKI